MRRTAASDTSPRVTSMTGALDFSAGHEYSKVLEDYFTRGRGL
jgi:hypothetical protein